MECVAEDSVGKLIQACKTRGVPLPVFSGATGTGHVDKPEFTVHVTLAGNNVTGTGASKQRAKRDAAAKGLQLLEQRESSPTGSQSTAKSTANMPLPKRPKSNRNKKTKPVPKPSFEERCPEFCSDNVRELPPYQQMRLLEQQSQLDSGDCYMRETIRQQLEFTFRKQFRHCSVRLFGSSVNTFGMQGSDVDCFLDLHLDGVYTTTDEQSRSGYQTYSHRDIREPHPYLYETWHLTKMTHKKILNLMGKQMHYVAKQQGWTEVHVISNARAPILKLHHGPSNFSVDVSFTSRLILQNTGMLTLYSFLDRRVRPLVFTLRHWADVKGLSGPNGFTKYALTLLLIFYLCNTDTPVLPTPKQITELVESQIELKVFLQPNGKFSFDLPLGGLFALAQWLPKSKNTKSEDVLLVDFFNYLSTFLFRDMVLCGWTGKVIPAETFRDVSTTELESFKFRHINFQDPFDLAHNITRNIDLDTFMNLLHYLADETTTLRKKKLNMVALLERGRECETLPLPTKITFASVGSTVPYDNWVLNITDLVKSVLEDFFKCHCTKNDSALQNSRFAQTGKVVEEFACQLQFRTWGHEARQAVSKVLKSSAPHTSEWDLEFQVGEKLSEHQMDPLHFTVTIVEKDCPSESLCVMLSSDEKLPDMTDWFHFLSKYLLEKKRWLLTMAHSVTVQTSP